MGAAAPAAAAGAPGTAPVSDHDWAGALADGIDKVGQFAISATGATGVEVAGGLKVLSTMFHSARLGGEAAEAAVAAGALSREAGSIRSVNVVGGTMNCVNCAIATDATLAGRSTLAMRGGVTQISVLERQFGGKFGPAGGVDQISAAMSSAGNGARGIVFGSRGSETGHVFNVVNQGGTIRFLDGQSGRAATFDGYQSFQLLRTN